MKKNISQTIRRAERFPVILIGEGLWWEYQQDLWCCSTDWRSPLPEMR